MRNAYLVGDKVYLRALERGDLRGPMFQWANDPEVTRYMYMGVVPNTIETLEHEYELLREGGTAGLLQLSNAPKNVVYAVVAIETDVHIGNVGLFGIDWIMRVAEFRNVIGDRDYWGRGHGFEAYRLVIGYAFDRLNLRRLNAGARADNVASIGALKKVGFVEEGVQREAVLRAETPYDVVLYALLRRDFYTLFPPQA
jgi:RimJ/RimL family protein N-acetyltransferase